MFVILDVVAHHANRGALVYRWGERRGWGSRRGGGIASVARGRCGRRWERRQFGSGVFLDVAADACVGSGDQLVRVGVDRFS